VVRLKIETELAKSEFFTFYGTNCVLFEQKPTIARGWFEWEGVIVYNYDHGIAKIELNVRNNNFIGDNWSIRRYFTVFESHGGIINK